MDMKGEYVIAAPRERVWAALNDVAVLKAAIPGCHSIARLSDTQIEATVTVKVGPVKASFKGLVTLTDLDPPNSYTIRGEGKGGAAGFAKGGAKVALTDEPDGTRLRYEVDAAVGGKLAQIGGRLIASTAKKLAHEFFSKFGELTVGPGAELAAMTPTPESGTVPEAAESKSVAPRESFEMLAAVLKVSGRWFLIAVVLIVVILAGIYGISRG